MVQLIIMSDHELMSDHGAPAVQHSVQQAMELLRMDTAYSCVTR